MEHEKGEMPVMHYENLTENRRSSHTKPMDGPKVTAVCAHLDSGHRAPK